MPAITGVETDVPPTSDGVGLGGVEESVSASAAGIPDVQVLAELVDPLIQALCGVQKM
jgi:hypothetical protein